MFFLLNFLLNKKDFPKSVYTYKFIDAQMYLLHIASLIHSSHVNLYRYHKLAAAEQR